MMTSAEMATFMGDNPDGGTFALDGSELPTTGYYVGGLVSPLLVDDLTTTKDVAEFIDYLKTVTGARYVGWWTDDETGAVWIDGVSWVDVYINAEVTCVERGEIAFYDIERRESYRPILVR